MKRDVQAFYALWTELAGSRTEKIGDSHYAKMQRKKIAGADLDGDEKAALEEAILKEAAYLKGLLDGIWLAKLL